MIPTEKTCAGCGKQFMPRNSFQKLCLKRSCAMKMLSKDKKAERVKFKERKEKAKRKSDLVKDAQTVFNAYIRARDAGQPCISCQRHHQGQYHAGHYLSTGARPELRFEEENVHLQCAPCNNHLSGNAVLFRQGLIAKRGLEVVEWLEGPHEPKKYSRDELIELKETYRRKLKELKESQE